MVVAASAVAAATVVAATAEEDGGGTEAWVPRSIVARPCNRRALLSCRRRRRRRRRRPPPPPPLPPRRRCRRCRRCCRRRRCRRRHRRRRNVDTLARAPFPHRPKARAFLSTERWKGWVKRETRRDEGEEKGRRCKTMLHCRFVISPTRCNERDEAFRLVDANAPC